MTAPTVNENGACQATMAAHRFAAKWRPRVRRANYSRSDVGR